MNEHYYQQKRPVPVFAIATLVTFGIGLLLGFVGNLFLVQPGEGSVVLLLLFPLLLGMIGMLAVDVCNQRQLFNGLCAGWLAWGGLWLSSLLWESFQPQAITDCLHSDGAPCGPTFVPFWGEFALLFLFVYIVVLAFGLFFAAVGSTITYLVLNFICWIRNKLKSPSGASEKFDPETAALSEFANEMTEISNTDLYTINQHLYK